MDYIEKRRKEDEERWDALPIGPYSLLQVSTRKYMIISKGSVSGNGDHKTLNFMGYNDKCVPMDNPPSFSYLEAHSLCREWNRNALGLV